ncbi:MAG: NAD(P)-binding domain-containing protein [Acidobacteriota bacterium]
MSTAPRACVIGAGPSGLTAAKNLLQVGIEPVVYEARADLGGNWNATSNPDVPTVFDTTRLISSKTLSAYEDFPFPADTDAYPRRQPLAAYFDAYAERFGLRDHIRFHVSVESVAPIDNGWSVRIEDKTTGERTVEPFDAVFVCNGHHATPRIPAVFQGHDDRVVHSSAFWRATPFAGERVLVVGGGNSGCDIAVEVSRVAKTTHLSWRRGYHIVPRHLFGMPSDVVLSTITWLPDRWIAFLADQTIRRLKGRPSDHGLPTPEHGFFDCHPIINDDLPRRVRAGRIAMRRDVESLDRASDGLEVRFVDGVEDRYDRIIVCTGFEIRFPFLSRDVVDFAEGSVPLYLRVFDPRWPGLFFIGLIQPMGCIWPLADLQAKLAANLLVGNYRLPADHARRAERDADAIVRRFVDSPRHAIEVDYHAYRRQLLRALPSTAPPWTD